MKIELKPFNIPNFVIPILPAGRRQDGFTPIEGIPLSAVDAEELSDMCDAFRAEVFKKAGLKDPFMERLVIPPSGSKQ